MEEVDSKLDSEGRGEPGLTQPADQIEQEKEANSDALREKNGIVIVMILRIFYILASKLKISLYIYIYIYIFK